MTNAFAKYDSSVASLSCPVGRPICPTMRIFECYGYQIEFNWQLKTTFSVVMDKSVLFISLCGLMSPWHCCFFLRKIKFIGGWATKAVSENIQSDP